MIKEYYRLDDLKESFDFSLSDIDYLVAESKIKFCLFSKSTNVIIGGWRKGKFVGFGQANYSGLISLTSKEQTELFEKNKLNLTQSNILQKEKLVSYKASYPFNVTTPNTVIEEWNEKELTDIEWEHLPFRFYPEERKSNLKMFEGLVEQLGAIAEVKTTGKYSGDSIPNPLVTVKNELFFHWKSFSLNDVCILADEIIKAQQVTGIIQNEVIEEPKVKLSTTTVHKEIKTRTDDFNDLLIEIIRANPKKTAKIYWRIIEEESSELEGCRVFDKNNLIRAISENDSIEWVDKKSRPRKSISFGSFSNRVSRMKKLIFDD
ncbi:hypothetical protein [Thalassotalea sp. PP2-459]|uniref:hypothetical protein n=1 Tax=Thalassotalea sp. PP2-459 TaxID=1742724 RepID=UPI001115481E|nr:hypothetical protein [Thalassotalea sp. PP2-459]